MDAQKLLETGIYISPIGALLCYTIDKKLSLDLRKKIDDQIEAENLKKGDAKFVLIFPDGKIIFLKEGEMAQRSANN